MIPYFYLPTINLGFFSINTWGLFAALGFAFSIFVAWKHAKCRAQNPDVILDLSFWLIIASIVGARVAHVFLYEWDFYSANPMEIIKIWHGGLSSFGGFIGAGLVGWLYLRKKQLNFLGYADTFIFSLPAGLALGRIGCFLIHDHPGTLTHFILGVKYPDGTRHDVGLYLGIFDVVLFLLFLVIEKTVVGKKLFPRGIPIGFYVAAFAVVYSVVRFFLDFLRAYDLPGSDIRYALLTPAQYGSILIFIAGLWLVFKIRAAIQRSSHA